MAGVAPVVRHWIVCEDVQTDPANPHRITIAGLITSIRSLDSPPYPLHCRELCVFMQLTECRGPAEVRIEIAHADSGQLVIRTKTRPMAMSNEPLEVHGLVFRIQDCTFPQAGLYLVQVWYNDLVIAERPLLLR